MTRQTQHIDTLNAYYFNIYNVKKKLSLINYKVINNTLIS